MNLSTPVVVPLGHGIGYGRDADRAMFRVLMLAGTPVPLPRDPNLAWVAAHTPLAPTGDSVASLRTRLPGHDDDIDLLVGSGLLVETDLEPTGQWAGGHRLSALAHCLGATASGPAPVGFGITDPQAHVGRRFGAVLMMADAFPSIAEAVRATVPDLSATELAEGLFQSLRSGVAFVDRAAGNG